MSTKHYDAAYAELLDEAQSLVGRRAFTIGEIAGVLARLIAKRDERIEALERRLAALEGDAK